MKYFTISEMIHSATAVARRIWNGCGRNEEDNLTALIENVLDPARERYGKAIHVSSGFRSAELNRIVHGSQGSQHLLGMAADVYTDAGPEGNLELARVIAINGRFDQMILEDVTPGGLKPKWVHVSWNRHGRNRRQILKMVYRGNTATYQSLSESEKKLFG